MKYIYNNDEHQIPQYRDCECSFQMKLEASENTKGDISYFYKCSYNHCDKVIKVEDIENV